jgi:aldose 1-epimerase
MSVNGTLTLLQAGDYRATIGSVGAGLLSLTHRGRDLIQPLDPGELTQGYQGKVLVPWPNRVTGGRYVVEGTELQLAVNEVETGAALHGLACFQHWAATEVGADRVVLDLDLPPVPGYPYDVHCRAEYRLHPQDGLSLLISGRNDGSDPAPFGASAHPYLSCQGRAVDECIVRVPAAAYLDTDEQLAPAGVREVTGTAWDLRAGERLGDRVVDNAFTGLPEGSWTVELSHPEAVGVQLSGDTRWVQVYTGDRLGRRGVAVEPMTCPPDAFNSDLAAVLLAPGKTRDVQLGIRVL